MTIPSQLGDIDVRNLIKTLENDPNKVFVINWTVLADFYEDVREAVKQYYGITSSANIAVYSDYTLQYSVLAENGWYAGVGKFNCYSYALGITSAKRNPGYFSGQEYNEDLTVDELADYTIDDLQSEALGYNCVMEQTTRPLVLGNWENIIALRTDTDGDEETGKKDYHFAKFVNSNWLHKPGSTAILQFINPPANSTPWTNEYYSGSYYAPDRTYESNIVYILYKTDHIYTYIWTGEHFHEDDLHYFEREYSCECGDTYTVWEFRRMFRSSLRDDLVAS